MKKISQVDAWRSANFDGLVLVKIRICRHIPLGLGHHSLSYTGCCLPLLFTQKTSFLGACGPHPHRLAHLPSPGSTMPGAPRSTRRTVAHLWARSRQRGVTSMRTFWGFIPMPFHHQLLVKTRGFSHEDFIITFLSVKSKQKLFQQTCV